MNTSTLPTAAEVRAALNELRYSQMEELAKRSGVPVTTLRKIRGGQTENPGLDTVKQFAPHLDAMRKPEAA